MSTLIGLIGKDFGSLTVVKRGPNNKQGGTQWYCKCSCGSTSVLVAAHNLKSGNTKSCGCLHKRFMQDKNPVKIVHGNFSNVNWGDDRAMIYKSMHNRCDPSTKNKSYQKYYVKRGIKVCDRWTGPSGFANFCKDMGTRPSGLHSLDRVNNSGHYSPENCRWATAKEQANNKRQVSVSLSPKEKRMLEIFGSCAEEDQNFCLLLMERMKECV